jgi:multiple sugar transport system substrate-binding protein
MQPRRDDFDAQRLTRRGLLGAGAAAGAGLLLNACGGSGGGSGTSSKGKAVTINALLQKQAGYSEDDIRGMTAAFHAANPDITVKPTLVAYEALHDKIVAAAPAGTFDVVLIDVIWPAEFGSKHLLADITGRVNGLGVDQILPGALATANYNKRFYGVPWILDSKYLYYNDAMLKRAGIPASQLGTWDGVLAAAQKLKSKGIVKYPLIGSWSQAEAVVCDYAQLLGAYGGSFLDASGKPAFNRGGGVQALEFMRNGLKQGLYNPASTTALEEDVRKTFSQGDAAIALNWTYMDAMANDPKQSKVAGHVKVARTPKGPTGNGPGCNGSEALAISAGSQHQDAAWEYVKFLTGQRIQNRFSKSSLPIWKSSYDDPAVVKALPDVVPVAKEQLGDMILRPEVTNYNAASQQLQVEIQNALLGKKSSQQALDDAAKAFSSS